MSYLYHPLSFYGITTQKLGKGGYGVVNIFESSRGSTEPSYGRPVAVKRQELATQALREQTILRIADHPNIVPLIDTGVTIVPRTGTVEASGSTWMVMPLAKGTLESKSGVSRNVSIGTGLSDPKWVMYQIADAVGYLHEVLHIIHNDIKPSNILLLDDDTPLVADYGLSERLKCDRDQVTHTSTHATLWWVAPENLLDKPFVDPKNDVWSLGVVFLEMYLGKYAFPSDSEIDHVIRTVSIWPEEERESFYNKFNPKYRFKIYRPRVFGDIKDDGLRQLIMSMLRLNPDDRATMRDVLASPYFAEQRARRPPFFARPTLAPLRCEQALAMVEPPPITLDEANSRAPAPRSADAEQPYIVNFFEQLFKVALEVWGSFPDQYLQIRMNLLLTYYLRRAKQYPRWRAVPIYCRAIFYISAINHGIEFTLEEAFKGESMIRYSELEEVFKALGFVTWTPVVSDYRRRASPIDIPKVLHVMATGQGLELPTQQIFTLDFP